MISQIAALAKIEAILQKAGEIKFNTTLPINIEVKEKLDPKKYLLDVGKRELSVESRVKLEVGKSYWGQMSKMQDDGFNKRVTISNLLIKPHLLQKGKKEPILSFDFKELERVFQEKSPKEAMKIAILDRLSIATSKAEFLNLTNILNALNNDVFTMILTQNDKETLFQFKKRKREKKDKSDEADVDMKIDFYAAFEHLGPIEGVVELIEGEKRVLLFVYYENSLEFLKKELNSLDFEGFLYKKEGKITPLYEYGSSLLDVKG
jgi:hypothetical protein